MASLSSEGDPITSRFEHRARERGYRSVAGADEVGRGCLFGPVFAAAVVLDPGRPIRGLADSKVIDAERRELLAARIRERAVAWSIAAVDAFEIDRINIYHASRAALKQAIESLAVPVDFAYVDGDMTLDLRIPQESLVKGDGRCASIAAASIIAKVARDATLDRWSAVFPGYALDSNKGYSAPQHFEGLDRLGPTALHRFTFEPVRRAAGLGQVEMFA